MYCKDRMHLNPNIMHLNPISKSESLNRMQMNPYRTHLNLDSSCEASESKIHNAFYADSFCIHSGIHLFELGFIVHNIGIHSAFYPQCMVSDNRKSL